MGVNLHFAFSSLPKMSQQHPRKIKQEAYDTSRLLTTTQGTNTNNPGTSSNAAQPIQRLGAFRPSVPAETSTLSKKFAINTNAARKKPYENFLYFF